MVGKIERVTAFNAEEVAIDPALVAIVAAHNLHACVGTPRAERRLTAIAAVCASCGYVLHLPGACFVAIRAGSECAHGADIDAHAAFFALEMVFLVRNNGRNYAPVVHSKPPNVHAFAANADAAVAKNATRSIEINHR